jgi:glucose/arabinose dehydrogenase
MTQRFLSPRLLATTALLLGCGGLIGLACGTDERSPGVVEDENPLNPDPGASGGTGGASATPDESPVEGDPVNAGGTEGQLPGNLPIAPGETPTEPGAENPPAEPPPTGALAPNCDPAEGAVPALTLELVADGLNEPIYVTGVPGDDSRLFVLEKGGTVRVLVDGVLQEQPFLDITPNVVNQGERGLLGLAFHPRYAENGLFYLHHSSVQNDSDGVIAEFAVSADNRSVANPASRRDILVFTEDSESNHNGGEITFGADGFLYIGMGDGGGGNDQHGPAGNGQNLNTLLGKLLRIDVDGRDVNGAYGIPPNNLAAQTGQTALPEIWAYGLRNPWRFSFDACTQDLYIGDVGQNTLEEIDFLPSTTLAGTNFGWRIMEGPNCRPNDTVCPQFDLTTLTLPIDSYPRTVGVSVTGGYVYRGANVPGLRGRYIYADYQSARFFSFIVQNGQLSDRQEITAQLQPAGGGDFGGIGSFGQDNAGEVYVAAFEPGAIYRVAAAP